MPISDEILEWLSSFKQDPEKGIFDSWRASIERVIETKDRQRFGWSVIIPKYLQSFDLD